ncbi:MAG: leucine-rich repeat domain-containing protein, partial [Duncaniella sp.]|nr:leucine-rich repeat domain-containing protein [Duncaniella sp.]
NGCAVLNSLYLPDGLTSIADSAFMACSALSFIDFPSTLTSIGDRTFMGCEALSFIDFPGSLTSIGASAFKGCKKLEFIELPQLLTTVKNSTFAGCTSLYDIKLNSRLETIEDKAFYSDRSISREALYIPASLKSVGRNAFTGSEFKKVVVSDLSAWCDIDFAEGSSNPASTAFDRLWLNNTRITDLEIPEGVTEVKPYTFNSLQLKSLKLPNSLKTIGQSAFADNELKELVIPSKVTSIGDYAFGNHSEKNIVIPASVNHIGSRAFTPSRGITMESVTIEDGVTEIDIHRSAFYCENIWQFVIPETVYLGRHITTLPGGFDERVKDLTLGQIMTEIKAGEFERCYGLTKVNFGSSINSIGESAFRNCSNLNTIVLPPSIETIEDSAFDGCSSLESVVMGCNIKKVGENAFNGCPAKSVSITAQTPPSAYKNTFSNYNGTLKLQDPGDKSLLDAYYEAIL